jgi:DNA-directed RNA polymerase specialized sigma subunit
VRAESYEDVVQVGTIGLVKAISRFDPQYKKKAGGQSQAPGFIDCRSG